MKALLALSPHPDFAEAIRGGVSSDQYRVIYRAGLEEAEPLLAHGVADVCILDAELTSVLGVWSVEKIRRFTQTCPVIVYVGARQPEWEEQAYVEGVSHVLSKPVRPRVLMSVLDRIMEAPSAALPPSPQPLRAVPEPGPSPVASATQTLGILRSCSGILSHSLQSEAMLRQLLLLLREILSVNRAAIFLKQPLGFLGSASGTETRRLKAACSVGISTGLLEHFELSCEAGIGAHLLRFGRILRRESDAAGADLETQKEFELLGAQVAVPILDRENVVGVAVFDGRVTGESLSNSELQLVFHLLEQLGLALKNIWLHEQVTANHELIAGVLRELNSACLVVGRDLVLRHANKMARRYFTPPDRRSGEPDFSDLPPIIGAKIYQVLKTGAALSNFRYEPEQEPGSAYNVNIVPFQRSPDGLPSAALLMAEDLTQGEQLRRLEIEAANLHVMETMADRLTNEIGNALVPLSVHQQLLAEKMAAKKVDAEFLKMLERDLGESLKRIGRSNTQMRFLARSSLVENKPFLLAPVIEDACQEARKLQPAKSAEVMYTPSEKGVMVSGDRAALKHAFTELILNGLQSNPEEPRIEVRLRQELNGNGAAGLQVDITDNGPGFTAEAARKAVEPFWRTRVVGLGLGLTVSRKIIELHRGKLEIIAPKEEKPGCVRVVLPSAADSAA